MSEHTFKIVFSGETADGLPVEVARSNLSEALKLPSRQLDKLFSGKEVVVKDGLSKEVAQKIQTTFTRAGAVCVLKENLSSSRDRTLKPSDASVSPAIGAEQQIKIPEVPRESVDTRIMISYFLWFVFGPLGAHRIYNKEVGSGVAMLLLFMFSLLLSFVVIGIPGLIAVSVWWVVDAFRIPDMARCAYNTDS